MGRHEVYEYLDLSSCKWKISEDVKILFIIDLKGLT